MHWLMKTKGSRNGSTAAETEHQHPAVTAIRERETVRCQIDELDRMRIQELEESLEEIGKVLAQFKGTHKSDPMWVLVRNQVRRVMCIKDDQC